MSDTLWLELALILTLTHVNLIPLANEHPYLNNLTPLRGAAALWVAVYHFGNIIKLFSSRQTMLIEKGYLMVDLFFIMSGFIILHVYGHSFDRRITRSNLRRLFVARFARIYPLHFFTLMFMVLMAWVSNDWNIVNDPAAIPINLLLLQSFGFTALSTWNRLSWSLSAEWAAYLVFPVLALLITRSGKFAQSLLLVLIVVAYIALVYWLPPKGVGNADRLIRHKLDVTYDYGFIRGIAGFTLGMLSYGLYSNLRVRDFFSKDRATFIFVLLIAFCMHKGVNDLYLILPFAGLVLSFASNSGRLHQCCSLRPAQFIGKVSYSIYLIQKLATDFFILVLQLFGINLGSYYSATLPFLPRLLYTIAYLSVLVVLSSQTYEWIENPCRNFINRHFISPARKAA